MKQTPEVVIQELTVQDQAMFEWVAKCVVTDTDTQKNAENLLISARAAFKRADGERKGLLEPVLETQRRINDLFRPYLARVTTCVDTLNGMLQSYHREQVKQAEAELTYAQAVQAHKIADARETGEIVELPDIKIQTPAKTSRPEMGSVTYRDDYDVQIVQPDLVPRDLCEPSMVKIRARIKSGIKDIQGVLITQKYTPVSRVL